MNPDDDLIKAALMEDEEDLREKEEKSTPEEPETKAAAPEPEETASEEADEDDELEAEEESESEEKPTRKERREAKKQAWLENVRREQPQQEQAPQQFEQRPQPQQEQYKPIDYRQVEELNEQELERDRQTYAELSRRNGIEQGRQAERQVAEQDKFWQGVEYESKVLAYDPDFKFLDEKNPDTFEPDLAADLNEKYLAFVGYDDRNNTVKRTDISYEKFVRNEVAERRAWAERLAAESTANLAETKASTGLRPGGSRKSGLGQLKPGDISKMSDSELAKYEDEIDRQILSAFN